MKEKVIVFGEEIEIEKCPTCQGRGNLVEWSRTSRAHEDNENYPCERCKGAKYIVVSHWSKT